MSNSKPQAPWHTYILHCADNSLYTGVAVDLDRRVNEHNHCNKKGARYTRARRPVHLAKSFTCENRAAACRLEAQIKRLSKRSKEQLVNGQAAPEDFSL